MSSDTDSHYKFYHYKPSLPGACVFAILFSVTAAWHGVLIAKHRTWYFIPLLIGGIFEIVGYIARGVSYGQAPNPTLAPYVISTLLILVAPALLAASIYMVLGRIIVGVDAEAHSLIKARWLTKVFVTSDVASFLIQLAGGGLMASSAASTAERGSHLVLAGLVTQIVIFSFFVAVAVVLHRRLRASPTSKSHHASVPWEKFLCVLYIASAFIMFRSIIRVAEFVEGFAGTIIRHEVYLFTLDGLPMAAVMIVFNIWYPSLFSSRAKQDTDQEREASSVEL
ncbi:RTA1 like protein [Amniculicola lignicola CBS 123094]|uniref:RTA1 like protein n=1 Tax=Amniculicola lignicola CBS 123094 TaxID=1392246 RepID=A0A6A5WI60_9PLEO|nr:RTA1 like protein [Amniculicola lignicola CBS 123094]